MNHDKLLELHKKLEKLIVPIYLKYESQLSAQDKEDYQEFMYQGEYELAISNLLGSLKNHSIKLDSNTEMTVEEIYKLMNIDRPVIS